MNREEQLIKVQEEAWELFRKKNKDYGDAFASHGPVGVLVRLHDKLNRLTNITKTGVTLVEDEKLRDTLLDLHNYSAMAIMLIDERNTITEVPEHLKMNLSTPNESFEELTK